MPRPEARPLPLDVLDYYQVQAIERMSETLLSALQVLKHIPKARDRKNSDLDHFRSSNNFFLSGEAGSGKTTSYLSLREALKSDNPCSDDSRLKFPHFCRLKDESKSLVWLEPLDLESAPEVGNFLAAVLVRIEEEIEKGIRTDKRRRGLLEHDGSDALQEYERLQNNVVLAWEGNIPQRAEHLDPEIYALEVLNAAKASTKVKPRLQRALEELSAEEGRERQRLFVLPIDDFYLHPSSSLKLLRLLRMISVPQLFSLVMGDLYTLEELIYQDTLGKLVSLAGEQALGMGARNRRRKTLSSVATVLSGDSLRKLIPMGQRFHLAVMHQLGALAFFPQQLDPPSLKAVSQEQYRFTLKDFLGLLPVEIPLADPLQNPEDPRKIRSLLGFLRLRSTTKEGENDNYYTYSGLAILDLPPREVVDFWYSIKNALPVDFDRAQTEDEKARKTKAQEVGEEAREIAVDRMRERLKWKSNEAGWDATLKIVADATREAIFGQTYVSKEDQDTCAEAVKGPRGYTKTAFAPDFLKAEPDLVLSFKIPLENGTLVRVSVHQGWSFRANRPGQPQETDNLAPRPTAWLTVLHDLMSLSGKDRMAGDPLTPDRFNLRLVEVRSDSVSVGWPTPRWTSFWHFDRLAYAWRRTVSEAKDLKKHLDPADLLEWLVFHWVRYVTDVLLSNRHEIDVAPQRNVAKKAWEKLVADTVHLDSVREKEGMEPETREMIRDWLIDLAAMLSQDFAVPEPVRERFQRSALQEEFWQQREKSVTAAREMAKRKADPASEQRTL